MIAIDNLVQECCARNSHGLLQESKGGSSDSHQARMGRQCVRKCSSRRWTAADDGGGGPGPGSLAAWLVWAEGTG